MKCAWQAYLKLLPHWMRDIVDKQGKETLQELRLRIDRPPELLTTAGSSFLSQSISADDLNFCVNAASQYSPWSASSSANGYITAPGGHRIGICGDTAMIDGAIRSIAHVTSVNIRVARDFHGIALGASAVSGSALIIGSPGRGKTTLLRDLIRQKSNMGAGAVAVVDERKEIFPMADGKYCFSPGVRTDILSGCSKADGVQMLIRTMSPHWIAVDEITNAEDCNAVVQAFWCGVYILATAHAENLTDFKNRPVYKPLVECKLFRNIFVMQPDKSWTLERLDQ